jgi:hypothetical protein
MEQLKLLPRGLYSPTSLQRSDGPSVFPQTQSFRQLSRAPSPLLSVFPSFGKFVGASDYSSSLLSRSFANVGSCNDFVGAAKAHLLPPPMVYQAKEQEPLSEVVTIFGLCVAMRGCFGRVLVRDVIVRNAKRWCFTLSESSDHRLDGGHYRDYRILLRFLV